MISQKKLLLLVLLAIGVLLLQPVLAADTASTSMYASPATVTWQTVSATASPMEGIAPLTVQFKDTSKIYTMYCQWNFGDGTSVNGNLHTVSHTYSKAGTYFVSLTIQDQNFKYITSQVATITVNSPTPLVITNISAAISCPMVSFTGTSTGNPTSWSWNFGDGKTSTEQNPVHAYSANGDYLVTLTTTGLSGSNSVSKQVSVGCVIPFSINPIPDTIVGNVIPTSGNAGGYPPGTNLTITFQTDFSTTGVWKQWYPYVNVKNGIWSYTEISTSDWAPGKWTATINDSSSNSRSTSFNLGPKVPFRGLMINPIPDAVPGDVITVSGGAMGYPPNTDLTITFQTDSTSSTKVTTFFSPPVPVKNSVWSFVASTGDTKDWARGKWSATVSDSSGSSASTSFNMGPWVIILPTYAIRTWSTDGEFPAANVDVWYTEANFIPVNPTVTSPFQWNKDEHYLGRTDSNGVLSQVLLPEGWIVIRTQTPNYSKDCVSFAGDIRSIGGGWYYTANNIVNISDIRSKSCHDININLNNRHDTHIYIPPIPIPTVTFTVIPTVTTTTIPSVRPWP